MFLILFFYLSRSPSISEDISSPRRNYEFVKKLGVVYKFYDDSPYLGRGTMKRVRRKDLRGRRVAAEFFEIPFLASEKSISAKLWNVCTR